MGLPYFFTANVSFSGESSAVPIRSSTRWWYVSCWGLVTRGLNRSDRPPDAQQKDQRGSKRSQFHLSRVREIRLIMNWPSQRSVPDRSRIIPESTRTGLRTIVDRRFRAHRLTDMRMSAAVKADTLSNAGESGKAIFHITLSWKPISGRSSTEARAFIVTEGGLSANE